jgi:hypothetical protein
MTKLTLILYGIAIGFSLAAFGCTDKEVINPIPDEPPGIGDGTEPPKEWVMINFEEIYIPAGFLRCFYAEHNKVLILNSKDEILECVDPFYMYLFEDVDFSTNSVMLLFMRTGPHEYISMFSPKLYKDSNSETLKLEMPIKDYGILSAQAYAFVIPVASNNTPVEFRTLNYHKMYDVKDYHLRNLPTYPHAFIDVTPGEYYWDVVSTVEELSTYNGLFDIELPEEFDFTINSLFINQFCVNEALEIFSSAYINHDNELLVSVEYREQFTDIFFGYNAAIGATTVIPANMEVSVYFDRRFAPQEGNSPLIPYP